MNPLSPKERCLKVLNGELPDRIPVIPQSFMFSLEEAGYQMKDVVKNPSAMAKSHVICQEKYGYDGCVIDFDDATLAEACGAKVIYRDDEPAVVDESDVVLKDLRDVEQLELPDPNSGRIPVWLETTKLLVDAIGDNVFVMGRADQGPFTLACLLRGTSQFMMDIVTEDKELIHKVIDYCRQACVIFAKAQKDAGAHITSIGDALAGPNLISPDMFREFALQPEIALTKEVQDYGIPYSIHICGNTTDIISDMASTKADVLEIDYQIDIGMARKRVDDNIVLMGNVNPSDPLVFGTPEEVKEASRLVIEKCKGRGLILSSGCAMGRKTPTANLKAMINAADQYGRYEQIMEMK
mgnify:CR=1 FL=1